MLWLANGITPSLCVCQNQFGDRPGNFKGKTLQQIRRNRDLTKLHISSTRSDEERSPGPEVLPPSFSEGNFAIRKIGHTKFSFTIICVNNVFLIHVPYFITLREHYWFNFVILVLLIPRPMAFFWWLQDLFGPSNCHGFREEHGNLSKLQRFRGVVTTAQ